MPQPNRFRVSLAGTAAVALASLPLAISPASAAKVTEGTTSSIGMFEASSIAQQFNLGNLGAQGSTTDLVASRAGNGGNAGLFGARGSLQGFLSLVLQRLGLSTADWYFPTQAD